MGYAVFTEFDTVEAWEGSVHGNLPNIIDGDSQTWGYFDCADASEASVMLRGLTQVPAGTDVSSALILLGYELLNQPVAANILNVRCYTRATTGASWTQVYNAYMPSGPKFVSFSAANVQEPADFECLLRVVYDRRGTGGDPPDPPVVGG